MVPLGFSTGCLSYSKISYEESIELYHLVGANAVELGIYSPSFLLDLETSRDLERLSKRFNYVSVHAPKVMRYGNNEETREFLDKLGDFSKRMGVKGIVVHPNCVDDYEFLAASNLPLWLENMDRGAREGVEPEFFEYMRRTYDFGFVFDVQHAYEHDPSLMLARDIVDAMGANLMQMHVSGNNGEEIHHPVWLSSNQLAILNLMKMRSNVPIILEGIISSDKVPPEAIMEKELEFVGRFL